MEERRLLLAVALSLLVLTGYRLFVTPAPAPSGSLPEPAPAPSSPPPPVGTVSPPPAPEPAPASAAVRPVSDGQERRVEVVGSDLVVAFSNRGARLISWKLLRYADQGDRPEEMVQTASGALRPLDLETGDPEIDARLHDALFVPSAETLRLPASGEAALVFRYVQGDLEAEKILRFPAQGYLVGVSASVRRAGRPFPVRVAWGPGLGNASAEEQAVQGYQPPQVVAYTPEGVERIPIEKIGAARALPQVAWVGIETHYFAALLVPPGGPGAGEVRATELPPGEDGKPRQGPAALVSLSADGAPALLYVGPKDHQGLSRLGHGLAQVVPVGEWIGPIVVPLMRLLRWVEARVGNYGWSIVALTVLINLAMAPLRHYSIANGVKMAKIAPEMRVIQERYRGLSALDKRREQMQREIGELYAKHGMSMGGQMAMGCFPLLLTLPFLFAFYRVLQVSIELRGASFVWIPDLSQKDPLYITPILMGLSMFLMQKMTPSAMDPAQQRMMMVMPLVLMVMFFAAPAGLNLYWLASNVCSIVQQGATLRILRAPEGAKARRPK